MCELDNGELYESESKLYLESWESWTERGFSNSKLVLKRNWASRVTRSATNSFLKVWNKYEDDEVEVGESDEGDKACNPWTGVWNSIYRWEVWDLKKQGRKTSIDTH